MKISCSREQMQMISMTWIYAMGKASLHEKAPWQSRYTCVERFQVLKICPSVHLFNQRSEDRHICQDGKENDMNGWITVGESHLGIIAGRFGMSWEIRAWNDNIVAFKLLPEYHLLSWASEIWNKRRVDHTCFAPCTHLLWSSSHHTGGLPGATAASPGCPVTRHRYGNMYIFASPQPLGTWKEGNIYSILPSTNIQSAYPTPLRNMIVILIIRTTKGLTHSPHRCSLPVPDMQVN